MNIFAVLLNEFLNESKSAIFIRKMNKKETPPPWNVTKLRILKMLIIPGSRQSQYCVLFIYDICSMIQSLVFVFRQQAESILSSWSVPGVLSSEPLAGRWAFSFSFFWWVFFFVGFFFLFFGGLHIFFLRPMAKSSLTLIHLQEFPFFVVNQGWASVSPPLTKLR